MMADLELQTTFDFSRFVGWSSVRVVAVQPCRIQIFTSPTQLCLWPQTINEGLSKEGVI